MKSLILFISVCLIFPFFSLAQKQDFVWYCGSSYNGEGASFFFFNDTGHTQFNLYREQSNAVRDHSAKSTMADEEGNLLFFTDGFDIFNKNFEIMDNGDSVFHFHPSMAKWYDHTSGYNAYGWSLILPVPESDRQYIVLYQDQLKTSPEEKFYATGLTYNLVDLNYNNGLGKVIKKKEKLWEGDIMLGFLKAVRHANGRDWWIPVKKLGEPVWHMFLLDPSGINLSHTQEKGNIDLTYSLKLQYNYSKHQFLYVSDEFYYVGAPVDRIFVHDFFFFDFDRCRGTLSLNRQFEVSTIGLPFVLSRIAFSPGGKYLYLLDHGERNVYAVQIDLTSPDPPSTRDTLFDSKGLSYTRWGTNHLKVTPHGELWALNWADPYITVLKNPELPGPEVNLLPEPIETAWINGGTFPNNANYRVGPIDGSPCDTLGINNEPRAWYRYNDINLDYRERRFTDLSYFRPEQWHWDFDDGTTYDGQHPGVHEFPAPGEYYVCLTVSNEYAEDTYCEWIVIDELSNTEELSEAGQDFTVFPNPTSGDFTIRLHEPISHPTEIKVYDLLGRELHRHHLSGGAAETRLSLEHLPSGRYVLQLFDGERFRTGSVLRMEN